MPTPFAQSRMRVPANESGVPYDASTPMPVVQTGTPTNPTGAATSAKQDTIIGHVDGIETALTAANASLDAIEAVPAPMTSANFLANLRSTAAFTTVNSANTSTTILASNANRKGAVIVNTDANALYLDLTGGTAATTRYASALATGDKYEVPFGITGAITGIWAADGAGAALVTEAS